MAYVVSDSTPTEVSSLSAPTGAPSPATAQLMSSSRAPSVTFAPELAAATQMTSGIGGLTTNIPESRPPPEPPPPLDIEDVLKSLPKEDRAAFASRFIKDSVLDSPPSMPRDVAVPASRIIFQPDTPQQPPPITHRALVEYFIPLDKARST
jgi:hypothetical protein